MESVGGLRLRASFWDDKLGRVESFLTRTFFTLLFSVYHVRLILLSEKLHHSLTVSALRFVGITHGEGATYSRRKFLSAQKTPNIDVFYLRVGHQVIELLLGATFVWNG